MIAVLRHYAFALLSGLLLTLAFPAFDLFFLAWVALVPLLCRVLRSSPWEAAAQFFVAGWLFHSLLLQWLAGNVHWAGGWALLGHQLLCVFLGLYWAALGALWTWAHRRAPKMAGAFFVALLWVGMEWLQARILSGFGWSALGYSQGFDLALLQCAALGGVSLVSFLLVLVNALLALLITEPTWRLHRLGALAGVLVLSHLGGWCLLGTPDYGSAPLTVGLYQSNYSQKMKWDWEYAEDMVHRAAYQSARLAQFEQVGLFVWPEALVVRHFEEAAVMQSMTELTTGAHVPLFAGAVRNDREQGRSYNSSVLIDAEGKVVDTYDKVHLAPFGEYVPFERYLPFLKAILLGSVDAGTEQKVLPVAGRRLGPLICFEVLFTPLAERLRQEGADFLAVVTNLAWFGDSNVIPQEFELARLRAIETRLPLVHSANTGISGVFDPWGRFQPLCAAIGPNGRYVKWEDEPVDPESTVMQRRVGALPVAAAVRPPIPRGCLVFPWLAMAGAILMMAVVLIRPVRPPGGLPKRPTEMVAAPEMDTGEPAEEKPSWTSRFQR